MSLPRRNRLKRQQDFAVLYKFGVRRSTSHLTLRAMRADRDFKQPSRPKSPGAGASQAGASQPNTVPAEDSLPCLSDTQIGISISRKVSKRAVVRNRIRRQIQSIFRQFLPQFQKGWLITIVVHPKAIQCRYSQFLRELEELLVDAEVINGH